MLLLTTLSNCKISGRNRPGLGHITPSISYLWNGWRYKPQI